MSLPEMTDDTANTMADRRSRLTRWWQRKTISQFSLEGHMICRTTIGLSIRDRLLVLLGRDIVVMVSSPVEPNLGDAHVNKMIDGLFTEARTEPRRWR